MTIKEIANLAGVSISTVSKIVNKKDSNINPETRDRVLQIVKEYNYTPYGTVKTLNSPKRFLIAVLLKSSEGYGDFLPGISAAAQERGYGLLVFHSNNSPEDELKHITTICHHKADGVLWEAVSEKSRENQHYFSDADIPFVFINSPSLSRSFCIDYQQLGYLCAEKLLQYQHRKIGFLSDGFTDISQQIYTGIRNCLFQYHMPAGSCITLENGDSLISTLSINQITGIICGYTLNSFTFYKQLNTLHIHIPSDLSLISLTREGHDSDIPFVSGINVPFRSLGYLSCCYLIQLSEKAEKIIAPFSLESRYTFNHDKSIASPAYLGSGKFIVIGSINNDVTLAVDDFPETGKSTLITNSLSCAGGKGTNQSIGVSRMGHEAFLIGRVGRDADSMLIFDALNQEHLSTEALRKDEALQTGKAYVYVLRNGEVTITYIPGANLKLTAADVLNHENLFQKCEYCLISMDIPEKAALQAANLARKHHVKTIVKPSALSSLPEEFYHMTDIFIPNKQEAATICPSIDTVEEQAEYFIQHGIPTVIITLGADGCYLKTKDLSRHFPAPDFPIVDATGGADAFISSLAAHLSDGYPLLQAIQISQYAAGFCISRQGVTNALIDKSTLHNYIKKEKPWLL